MGRNRIDTGRLSRSPDRIEVITRIKMHNKKRLAGATLITKSSRN
jgi:hypothetical protein